VALLAIPAPAAACDGWGVPFRSGSSALSRRAERGLSRFLVEVGRLEQEERASGARPWHYRVDGLADWRGPAPNPALARRRAEIVRARLIGLRVSAAKIAIGATAGERGADGAMIAFGPSGTMCGGDR
jgi:hypothetical protein